MLNPDHKDSSHMKYRRFGNPDNLKDVAIDSGMALAAGAGAAVAAGAVMVGVSKIEYAASTPVADQAMYRTALASGILALVGMGMQYGGPKVAGAGKALLVGAVAIPGSVFVAVKLTAAMAPALTAPLAPALPAPSTGPTAGLYGYGIDGWSPSQSRSLEAPAGFVANPPVNISSFIPSL